MKKSIDPAIVCLLAGITFAAAGCDNGSSTTPTTLPPTATSVTESFSGAVSIGGSAFNTFNVGVASTQLSVTMTAAGPPSTIYMGLGIGSYDGATCTLLTNAFVVAQAGATAQLSGSANAGSYCVMVYDAGNQTAPVTYAVTVTHF